VVGASTGGVVALQQLVGGLHPSCPPLLITQHMPPDYTARLARRLNDLGTLKVAEATDGAALRADHAYIAPGGRHLAIARQGAGYVCRVYDGSPVSGHKPSVDVLFQSAAREVGSAAIGVILTGMGRDRADGLLQIRHAGGQTFGQDEQSSVVYGMPGAAMKIGAVGIERPIEELAPEVARACRLQRRSA
jgi:two-component system chemotaxis response regulator CheB